jgi:hypothetical protein
LPANERYVGYNVLKKHASKRNKSCFGSNCVFHSHLLCICVSIIEAAQKAVGGWEAAYKLLQHCMVVSAEQTHHVYRMTKTGVARVEHHLLVTVRDVLILPAFFIWNGPRRERLNLFRATRPPNGRVLGSPLIEYKSLESNLAHIAILHPIPRGRPIHCGRSLDPHQGSHLDGRRGSLLLVVSNCCSPLARLKGCADCSSRL